MIANVLAVFTGAASSIGVMPTNVDTCDFDSLELKCESKMVLICDVDFSMAVFMGSASKLDLLGNKISMTAIKENREVPLSSVVTLNMTKSNWDGFVAKYDGKDIGILTGHNSVLKFKGRLFSKTTGDVLLAQEVGFFNDTANVSNSQHGGNSIDWLSCTVESVSASRRN